LNLKVQFRIGSIMTERKASEPQEADESVQPPENVNSAKPLDRLEAFRIHRGLLFSIAYRMVGSAADAEDILQETYIRWQQCGELDIRSPRAFLVTIASRLCINHLQSAQVRRQEYFGPWLPEPVFTGPMNDSRLSPSIDESLSMAFLLLLERLTPAERAVFLLHEVFDYEYSEIATMLDLTEANCRQILHRARQYLKKERLRFDPSPSQQKELIQQFLQASSGGDVRGLLAMFAKEIVLYADGGGKATAVPNPIRGADNVARFLIGARKNLMPADVVSQITEINGRLGIVVYAEGSPYGVLTVDIVDGRIQNIYIVTNPDKLSRLSHQPLIPN
jgi:RNA polymerase sigma-70 factor (ECF subfamily)